MQNKTLPEKIDGTHIHMVGIKGTGMAALVEILHKHGAVITGSDVSDRFYTDDILEKFGIKALPFSEDNITDDVALVIHSSAYNAEKNPDLAAAIKKNKPIMLYTEALGAISEKAYSCAISGVHGKTSTTGLAGTILSQLDLGAQILAGSVISSFGNSCTITTENFDAKNSGDSCKNSDAGDAENVGKKKNIFVAETCEYQRHFLAFHPEIIVITSVESDHQDYYPTYESMRDAFVEFAEKLPEGGKLIFCADDKGACEVAEIMRKKRSDIKLISYGENAASGAISADDESCICYELEFVKIENGEQYFKIKLPSENCSTSANRSANAANNSASFQFALRVPGKHEARDATAAVALCSELLLLHGKNPHEYAVKIRQGLLNFTGGKRRSEIIGRGKINGNSVIIMDDYGHHPTAIKTTLSGYKEFYPARKMIVDFMSHTYTRTAALLDEFASCFDDADEIILHKIYGSARENISESGITGKTLSDRMKQLYRGGTAGSNIFYFEEPLDCVDFAVEKMSEKLEEKFPDGYLFVTVGAGDNWKVGKEICQKFLCD